MAKIRVGVTGLSRAGKTVFITSTLYHLLATTGEHLKKFEGSKVAYNGRELPLPDGVDRFPYEENLECYRRQPPCWPPPCTTGITEFQVELKFICQEKRKRRHRLMFLDYPGERLLDTHLLDTPYSRWSDDVLNRLAACDGPRRAAGDEYRAAIHSASRPNAAVDDVFAELCHAYGKLCVSVYDDGLVLPPTDPSVKASSSLARSFCPLSVAVRNGNPALAKRTEAAYEQYKKKTVVPFLRRIGRCTHQIVLVDVLDILRGGQPNRYNQARQDMDNILGHFKYLTVGEGRFSKLAHGLWNRLPFRRPRIRKVIFCCTKADQAARPTRPNLQGLLISLVKKSAHHIGYQVGPKGMCYHYCAANCSTTPGKTDYHGQRLSVLIGRVKGSSSEMDKAGFPGEVPVEWPSCAEDWGDCRFPGFEPRPLPPRDGARLPHVHLDLVLYDLFKEYLK